jgi:Tfp pilus assembly protein PilF
MIARGALLLLALLAAEAPVPTEAEADPTALDAVLSPMERATVDRALQPFLVEGILSERQGNPTRAVSYYRLVVARDPYLPRAILGLGRSLLSLGDPEGAARVLGALPNDAEAVTLRAGILETLDPQAAILQYRKLRTLSLGDPLPYHQEALLLADVDPHEARRALSIYLDLEDGNPDLDAVLRVALSLKDHEDPDAALALAEEALRIRASGPGADELISLGERIGVEKEAARLSVGGAQPLTEAQTQEMIAAKRIFAKGDAEEALLRLRELLIRAPHAAEVWTTLGDVHLGLGSVAEAERAYSAAVSLNPDDAAVHARLGTLLAERYAGRRHGEAEMELRTALGLRPMWTELYLRLAQVRRERGDFDGATEALRAFLARGGQEDGADLTTARVLLQDLERVRPTAEALPAGATPATEVPEQARRHTQVARVYRNRGDLVAAHQELELALRLAPASLDALKLRAALLLDEGRTAEAAAVYEQCLSAPGVQSDVLLSLGEIRRSEGRVEDARRLFTSAADLGAPEASYLLAVLAWEEHRLLEARDLLRAFFEGSTGGLAQEPALALAERVESRLRAIGLLAALGIGLVLLVPGVILTRRRMAGTLRDLLRKDPSSWHEVARLLSAIRHEVLKHNTTLLHTVAVRLEQGDTEAAAFAAARLFGGEGVSRRFEGYVDELEALGRKRGMRLGLRHRDPVLTPMHEAFKRLDRVQGKIRRPRRARALVVELRQLSRALNEVGYRAIGDILREVCVLEVEASLFQRVYARVRAEPGIHGHAPERLEIEGGTARAPVRIFKADLEDIAANLFRNALKALMDELPRETRRVGLALVEEMDPVTGLEQIAIRFRDNAPRPIAESILRGRAIERGLGLAVDLLSRHHGVISVEDEPGWSKAFVVRLPRAEVGDLGRAADLETEEETRS